MCQEVLQATHVYMTREFAGGDSGGDGGGGVLGSAGLTLAKCGCY